MSMERDRGLADSLASQLADELLPNERVVWSGRPETSVRFAPADKFLVPFSLLWGGFAIAWEVGVLIALIASREPMMIFFVLFGIPFVLIGLHFIVGRFIYKNRRKRATLYALTTKRAIVLRQTGAGRDVQTALFRALPGISKTVRRAGIGTIRFGNTSPMAAMYENTGLDFFGSFYDSPIPAFYDVKDADEVFRIAQQSRNQLEEES